MLRFCSEPDLPSWCCCMRKPPETPHSLVSFWVEAVSIFVEHSPYWELQCSHFCSSVPCWKSWSSSVHRSGLVERFFLSPINNLAASCWARGPGLPSQRTPLSTLERPLPQFPHYHLREGQVHYGHVLSSSGITSAMRPDLEKQFRRCRGLGRPGCNNLRCNEARNGVLDWRRLPGTLVLISSLVSGMVDETMRWCRKPAAVRDSRAALL